MPEKLNANDFFTGFFAALTLRGKTFIPLRNERFESAMAALFEEKIAAIAAKYGVDLRFIIRLDPIHGTSTTVRDAVTDAAQRGIISLDNPVYQDARLKIDAEEARRILDQFRVDRGFFQEAAREFVDAFDVVARC